MDFIDALQRVLQSLGYRENVSDFLAVFGLALARVLTAISLSPFLGGRAVASNIKVGLSVVLTALLLPALAQGRPAPQNPVLLFALFAKEVMIGVTIGFLVQLLLYSVQTAGALIDVQRGMDQPGLHTPQLAGNVSVVGLFQFQLALVIFLFLNGHLMFIRALADSFARVPLLDFPPLPSATAMAEAIARISGQLFVVAFQLSAPVLITLFLVDAIFGAIGKVAAQVNVHQESQPVKAFVGLLILVPSLAFIFSRAGDLLSQMIWNIYNVLARFA
jgi:flagellar biosynthetic protein FliR